MLKHWVSPKSGAEFRGFNDLKMDLFGKSIQFFTGKEDNIKNQHIGLVGLDEINSERLREALYKMSFPWNDKKVIDLGNLRNSDPSFAIQFLRELTQGGIIPIVIGKHTNTTKILFEAFAESIPNANMVWLQEAIPQCHSEDQYWPKIFQDYPQRINQLGLIGSQSHFRSSSENKLLRRIPYEEIRLGKLRKQMNYAEPILRDADFVSIDAAVLRYSEAPSQIEKSPNGLFGEELCRLARYTGISDKVRGFSIAGFDLVDDPHQITASLMAQVIWYFIDGFYNRKGDYPLKEQNLTEYLIDIKSLGTKISFWKSTLSGRWWMQLPKSENERKNILIACTYEDYLDATKSEIPERLIKAIDSIRS